MKKLTLLAVSLLLLSCSADEVEVKTCNCVKLIQSRLITVTVTSTGQTTTTTPWQSTGAGQVTTDVKDCSQDGKVVYTNSFSNQNTRQEFRHILSCK